MRKLSLLLLIIMITSCNSVKSKEPQSDPDSYFKSIQKYIQFKVEKDIYISNFDNNISVYRDSHSRKYGLVNHLGVKLTKPLYDSINYDDFYNVDRYKLIEEKMLDENNLFPVKINNQYKIINRQGIEILPAKYDYISSFYQGVTVIEENGDFGYIDNTLTVITEPQFSSANALIDGIAVVKIKKDERDVYALFNINTNSIKEFKEFTWMDYRGYSEGFIIVKAENGLSIMDKNYKMLIPFGLYDDIRYFSNNRAIVCKKNDNRETGTYADFDYGVINRQGDLIVPIEYDEISGFSDNIAVFRKGSFEDGRHGFINLDGKIVIQPKYKSVVRYGPDITGRMIGFQYGLCAVQVDNGKWGYIDKNDQFIINPIFDKAEPFFSQFAKVEYNKTVYFLSIVKIKKDNIL